MEIKLGCVGINVGDTVFDLGPFVLISIVNQVVGFSL